MVLHEDNKEEFGGRSLCVFCTFAGVYKHKVVAPAPILYSQKL